MDIPLQPVAFGQKLAYQNVVSRRRRFHYGELAVQLGRFVSDVLGHGGRPRGPAFYSLNNVPLDEITDIEFFLPIREAAFAAPDGMRFHSYLEISPTVRGIVTGEVERRTEYVYAQLLAALESRGLRVNAPFFHVFPDDGSAYATVYLGYAEPPEA